MNRVKAIVLFTIFIDVIGIGVIIPVLPFYVRSFGASDTMVTLLFAVFAFLSFISAPMLGSLSDRIGRRPILIVSIISSAIGWIIFANAGSLIFLFIGRIIDGLAAGNITAAQSVLADIAKDDQERTANMGLFGMLFGIGLIIGPVIGGLLGSWGHSIPFWFVGVLAGVNAVLAYFFLPETHQVKHRDKKISINPIRPIIDGFRNREMRGLFFIWFLFCVGIAIQAATFSLFSSSVLGYTEKTIGIIYGVLGILIVLNQGVLLKRFWLKYFKEKALAKSMLLLYAVGMILIPVPATIIFFIGIIFATFAQGNLRTVFGGMIAGFNPNKRGEYLGISTSIMSLSLVLGSLMATAMFALNPRLPFFLAGLVTIIAYIFMKVFPLNHVR